MTTNIMISELFPIYGITLGETKADDAVKKADKGWEHSVGKVLKIDNAIFIQLNEFGFINTVYIDCSLSGGEIPRKWEKALGIIMHMQKDECLAVLKLKNLQARYLVEDSSSNRTSYYYLSNEENLFYVFSFDSADELDRILISYFNCSQCRSNDVEVKLSDVYSLPSYICNECGHRWGLDDLFEELEERDSWNY